jgi:two-component system response regulator RegX3
LTRVLVAEDEPAIADAVEYALRSEGFEVELVADGVSAYQRASAGFDLLILDLMLPRLSGTEVCRRLRAESTILIIMLTARSGEADRVLGLEIGADDYVTKPFSMAELIGRVRALLRRRELDREQGAVVRRVGDLELDFRRHEVRLNGRRVDLTPMEFKLLALLAGDPGRAFSRRELVAHLWDSEHVGDERACDAHIVNLRRKVEDDPRDPTRIVTVRGVGYALADV